MNLSDTLYLEWLEKNVQNGNVRYHSFDDFVDKICINYDGCGTIVKARIKTSDIVVAYKFIDASNYRVDSAIMEDFVEEVGNQDRLYCSYYDIMN